MTLPLVLASSSPFRRILMQNAGLEFQHRAADIDERAVEASLTTTDPGEVALALAEAKAKDVAVHFPGALVIGSDQTMSLGDRIYHKARDLAEARENLLSLAGKTHQLNSGVAIARDAEIVWRHVAVARMSVRPFSEAFLDHYLDRVGEKALSSVGAYQLEGEGIQLFSAIEGDYFTVIGLPMLPLLEALRSLGAVND